MMPYVGPSCHQHRLYMSIAAILCITLAELALAQFVMEKWEAQGPNGVQSFAGTGPFVYDPSSGIAVEVGQLQSDGGWLAYAYNATDNGRLLPWAHKLSPSHCTIASYAVLASPGQVFIACQQRIYWLNITNSSLTSEVSMSNTPIISTNSLQLQPFAMMGGVVFVAAAPSGQGTVPMISFPNGTVVPYIGQLSPCVSQDAVAIGPLTTQSFFVVCGSEQVSLYGISVESGGVLWTNVLASNQVAILVSQVDPVTGYMCVLSGVPTSSVNYVVQVFQAGTGTASTFSQQAYVGSGEQLAALYVTQNLKPTSSPLPYVVILTDQYVRMVDPSGVYSWSSPVDNGDSYGPNALLGVEPNYIIVSTQYTIQALSILFGDAMWTEDRGSPNSNMLGGFIIPRSGGNKTLSVFYTVGGDSGGLIVVTETGSYGKVRNFAETNHEIIGVAPISQNTVLVQEVGPRMRGYYIASARPWTIPVSLGGGLYTTYVDGVIFTASAAVVAAVDVSSAAVTWELALAQDSFPGYTVVQFQRYSMYQVDTTSILVVDSYTGRSVTRIRVPSDTQCSAYGIDSSNPSIGGITAHPTLGVYFTAGTYCLYWITPSLQLQNIVANRVDSALSSTPVLAGDTLITGNYFTVMAFNISGSGNPIFSWVTEYEDIVDMIVSNGNGLVVAFFGQEGSAGINAANGEHIWESEMSIATSMSYQVIGNHLLLPVWSSDTNGESDVVVKFHLWINPPQNQTADAKEMWIYDPEEPSAINQVLATPFGVAVVAFADFIVGLDLSDGTELWYLEEPGCASLVVDAKSYIVYASCTSGVQAIDLGEGYQMLRLPILTQVQRIAPSPRNNQVAVVTATSVVGVELPYGAFADVTPLKRHAFSAVQQIPANPPKFPPLPPTPVEYYPFFDQGPFLTAWWTTYDDNQAAAPANVQFLTQDRSQFIVVPIGQSVYPQLMGSVMVYDAVTGAQVDEAVDQVPNPTCDFANFAPPTVSFFPVGPQDSRVAMTLCLPSSAGRQIALYAWETGDLILKWTSPTVATNAIVLHGPNGIIAAQSGNLTCWSTATGQQLWSGTPAPGHHIIGLNWLDVGQSILGVTLLGNNHSFVAININQGSEPLWFINVTQTTFFAHTAVLPNVSSAAVGPATFLIIGNKAAGSNDKALFSVRLATGAMESVFHFKYASAGSQPVTTNYWTVTPGPATRPELLVFASWTAITSAAHGRFFIVNSTSWTYEETDNVFSNDLSIVFPIVSVAGPQPHLDVILTATVGEKDCWLYAISTKGVTLWTVPFELGDYDTSYGPPPLSAALTINGYGYVITVGDLLLYLPVEKLHQSPMFYNYLDFTIANAFPVALPSTDILSTTCHALLLCYWRIPTDYEKDSFAQQILFMFPGTVPSDAAPMNRSWTLGIYTEGSTAQGFVAIPNSEGNFVVTTTDENDQYLVVRFTGKGTTVWIQTVQLAPSDIVYLPPDPTQGRHVGHIAVLSGDYVWQLNVETGAVVQVSGHLANACGSYAEEPYSLQVFDASIATGIPGRVELLLVSSSCFFRLSSIRAFWGPESIEILDPNTNGPDQGRSLVDAVYAGYGMYLLKDNQNMIYGVQISSFEFIWALSLPSKSYTLAVGGNLIFVFSSRSLTLSCYNLTDGSLLWIEAAPTDTSGGNQLVFWDNMIFLPCAGGVYLVNTSLAIPATGTHIMRAVSIPLLGSSMPSRIIPIPNSSTHIVFAGSAIGAYNARTMRQIWSYRNRELVWFIGLASSPLGFVALDTYGGDFTLMFDINTGVYLFSVPSTSAQQIVLAPSPRENVTLMYVMDSKEQFVSFIALPPVPVQPPPYFAQALPLNQVKPANYVPMTQPPFPVQNISVGSSKVSTPAMSAFTISMVNAGFVAMSSEGNFAIAVSLTNISVYLLANFFPSPAAVTYSTTYNFINLLPPGSSVVAFQYNENLNWQQSTTDVFAVAFGVTTSNGTNYLIYAPNVLGSAGLMAIPLPQPIVAGRPWGLFIPQLLVLPLATSVLCVDLTMSTSSALKVNWQTPLTPDSVMQPIQGLLLSGSGSVLLFDGLTRTFALLSMTTGASTWNSSTFAPSTATYCPQVSTAWMSSGNQIAATCGFGSHNTFLVTVWFPANGTVLAEVNISSYISDYAVSLQDLSIRTLAYPSPPVLAVVAMSRAQSGDLTSQSLVGIQLNPAAPSQLWIVPFMASAFGDAVLAGAVVSYISPLMIPIVTVVTLGSNQAISYNAVSGARLNTVGVPWTHWGAARHKFYYIPQPHGLPDYIVLGHQVLTSYTRAAAFKIDFTTGYPVPEWTTDGVSDVNNFPVMPGCVAAISYGGVECFLMGPAPNSPTLSWVFDDSDIITTDWLNGVLFVTQSFYWIDGSFDVAALNISGGEPLWAESIDSYVGAFYWEEASALVVITQTEVLALDAYTGDVLLQEMIQDCAGGLPNPPATFTATSSPVNGDRLYFGFSTACLYRIDSSFSTLDTVQLLAPLSGTPFVQSMDYYVMAVDNFGTVYGFNAESLAPFHYRWTSSYGYSSQQSVALALGKYGYFVIASNMVCIEAMSGNVSWYHEVGLGVTAIRPYGGAILVGNADGTVQSFTSTPLGAPSVIWQTGAAPSGMGSTEKAPNMHSMQKNGSGTKSTGFSSSEKRDLSKEAAGKKRLTANGISLGVATLVVGNIVIYAGNNLIVGLNAATGGTLWTIPTTASTVLLYSIDGSGSLFASVAGSSLTVFSAVNGQAIGTSTVLADSDTPIYINGLQAILRTVYGDVQSFSLVPMLATPGLPTQAPGPQTVLPLSPLPDNWVPLGQFTGVPTLPPGLTAAPLGCFFALPLAAQTFLSCVNGVLEETYPLQSKVLSNIPCGTVATSIQFCLNEYISLLPPAGCDAGLMYINEALQVANHSQPLDMCGKPAKCSVASESSQLCQVFDSIQLQLVAKSATQYTLAPAQQSPNIVPASQLQFKYPSGITGNPTPAPPTPPPTTAVPTTLVPPVPTFTPAPPTPPITLIPGLSTFAPTTPRPSHTNVPLNSPPSGMSHGAVAGIAIFVCVVVVGVAAGAVVVIRRRRSKKEDYTALKGAINAAGGDTELISTRGSSASLGTLEGGYGSTG